MLRRVVLAILAVTAAIWAARAQAAGDPAGAATEAEPEVQVRARKREAGGDPFMQYYLLGPKEGVEEPKNGYALLVVLPGEETEGLLPFVKQLYARALTDDFVAAQLVPVKWTPTQKVLWPTDKARARDQEFTTEDFVRRVIKDVRRKVNVNPGRIFAFGWGEGGSIAYAVNMLPDKPVVGSFAAMATFKPHLMPSLKAAKGRPYCIYHSPEDKVVPFSAVDAAKLLLTQNGAKVKVVTFEGGHVWPETVHQDVRNGLQWLGSSAAPAKRVAPRVAAPTPKTAEPDGSRVVLQEGFETGTRFPDGWEIVHPIPIIPIRWDRGQGNTGGSSMRLSKRDYGPRPLGQVSLMAGRLPRTRKMKFSIFVKAQQLSGAKVTLRFLRANKSVIESVDVVTIAPVAGGPRTLTHGWTEYSRDFGGAAGATYMFVDLLIAGGGTVWYDDLTLSDFWEEPEKPTRRRRR